MSEPLSARERTRGRRLAITSHPFGMTYWMAFTQHMPTLALVTLGASEAIVGLQNSFLPALQALQLPTLRAVGRVSKRRILVLGQIVAVLGGIPMLFFATLASWEGNAKVTIALLSLAVVAAGLQTSNTVWFPLLRGFVEPRRIGTFFGMLRTGWHLALILYYVAAQRWLVFHPGSFAPLFAVAWGCGLLRIFLIAALPERSERTGERIRVREAFALLRQPLLRRYLIGVSWCAALRMSVVPFAIVMMRREVGFSEADVIVTTVAFFAGGFVSLYLWGRVVDRIGPAPVFLTTTLGMAALLVGLLFLREPGAQGLAFGTVFFFGYSLLSAGFGVADTHVLFGLAPPEAPARTLVVAGVLTNTVAGLAPIAVGLTLDRALAVAESPLAVYHAFFAFAAVAQALVFLPLRIFRR